MVKDKDAHQVLTLLPKDAIYYFCQPDLPRALDVNELYDKAHVFKLKGKIYSSVQNALTVAQEQALENDVIFIGGSTFVVAEAI